MPLKGLSDFQIKRIQGVYPILKRIQGYTQVPWQVLAAIWYRESFSVTPPKTPGGPWQFDPVPPLSKLTYYLNKYTTLSPDQKKQYTVKGINDFEAGGVFAACHLQSKVGGRLSLDAPDELVKDALWGYNGRAYGSADKSPYVMNGFDEAHYPMRLRGTIPDGRGGRKRVDIEDRRPGAFTIYKQLKQLFP